jgi:predicted acyl esterase
MSDVIDNQAPATGAEAATISLVDLQNVVKIIDYAADQGAFKGWAVIEQVASVRQKINAFVEAATAAQAANEQAAAGEAQAEATQADAAPAASVKKVSKRKAK